MAESGRLESDYSVLNRIGGSNPPLSFFKIFMLKKYLFLFILCNFNLMSAMVYDNRFFPLYLKYPIRRPWQCNYFQLQPFFMRADEAQGISDKIAMPNIFGHYDLINIANALLISSRVNQNPLRSDLRSLTSIPFNSDGRLDSQGLAAFGEFALNPFLSIGFSSLFMHVNSRNLFFLDNANNAIGQRQFLFNLRENLNNKLGLTPAIFSKTMFGDIDLYLRFGSWWPYCFKFRAIDLGLKVGVLIPSSDELNINNPAAIPSGSKHWGMYLTFENQYEVKEDWFFNLMLRASKRFSKTEHLRIPIAREPINYGAFIAPINVNPGWTFAFSPRATFEGIRSGLGCSVWYTLVSHLHDSFSRPENLLLPNVDKQTSNLLLTEGIDRLTEFSSWGTEHVTVSVFYDFARLRDCPKYFPRLSFHWDIPVNWLVSKRAPLTNGISLTLDIDF